MNRDNSLRTSIREYLERVAAEHAARGKREREALEHSFERYSFKIGKHTWKRSDLHVRS
jgi:hypothetical protein